MAISGQESVHRRANSVRFMEKLVARVLAIGEPLTYPRHQAELPPQLEKAIEYYIDESQSRALYVVPLCEARPESTEEEESRKPLKTIGALVAEEFSGETFEAQRVDAIARHAARAMQNSLEHSQIFLLPVWKALGQLARLFRFQTLPKTAAVLLLIAALVVAGIFVPGDFKLTADGTLQPEQRQNIFAEVRGVIDSELPVQHGSSVRIGTILAQMRDIEIEKQLERVDGDIRSTEARLEAVGRLHLFDQSNRGTDQAALNDMAAEATILEQQLESLGRQRDLLHEQQAKLRIASPVNGEVISWNIEDLLKNRPVERGDLLMTVADWDGPWVLELLLPDNKVGHLLDAQHELRDDLRVSYMVATDPDVTLYGTIKKVASSTKVDEKEGLGVLVTVEIDKTEVGYLRPGAKVTGRIFCGQRPIGYVWLHGVVEWVQANVIFRYF